MVRRVFTCSIYSLLLILTCCREEEVDLKDPHIRISRFPNGKKAALSITFDDGCPSVFTKIVPRLDKYQWKGSFYIISGTAEKKEMWDAWKELRQQGHEIGNHSLTHGYYLGALYDKQLLEKEIDSSFALMKARMGEAPFTFSHPFHSNSPLVDNMVFKNHFATRISPAGFCRMISLNDVAFFETELAGAFSKSEWIVTTAHGIDDCFSPMSQEFFDSFLQTVEKYQDSLHIDTFENIAKYKIESEYTKFTVSKYGPDFKVTSISNLPGEVFNYPLTVSVCNLNQGRYSIQSIEGETIPLLTEGEMSYIRVLPGSSFIIKVK